MTLYDSNDFDNDKTGNLFLYECCNMIQKEMKMPSTYKQHIEQIIHSFFFLITKSKSQGELVTTGLTNNGC